MSTTDNLSFHLKKLEQKQNKSKLTEKSKNQQKTINWKSVGEKKKKPVL